MARDRILQAAQVEPGRLFRVEGAETERRAHANFTLK